MHVRFLFRYPDGWAKKTVPFTLDEHTRINSFDDYAVRPVHTATANKRTISFVQNKTKKAYKNQVGEFAVSPKKWLTIADSSSTKYDYKKVRPGFTRDVLGPDHK